MCGITGWVDFKKPLVREQSIMEKMTDTLSKRGPDDTNIWGKRHVLFGHKRLAVVDLEGGRQPMTRTHQGYDYTICYNGELYNTEDLRKELRRQGASIQEPLRYRGFASFIHGMERGMHRQAERNFCICGMG
nr:hypothetical protein [Bacillus licheniformis]